MTSPFFEIPQTKWIAQNRSGFAILDKFPVSKGHALVIPRRLIATWWEAGAEERADLLALVDDVRSILDERHEPDGYNIGINSGAAAGQTVDHLHVHVIPRYTGDVDDPRGGVRHVIPALGNYLEANAPAESPLLDGVDRTLKLELLRAIINPSHDQIDLIVSFIMKSGLGIIDRHLDEAIERGTQLRVLTTDYLDVTDPDALARLLDLHEIHGNKVQVRIFSEPGRSFHPKAYLFHSSEGLSSKGFLGSSNLSRSGIDGGVEWNLVVNETTPLRESFEQIWSHPHTSALDHGWLADYRQRRQTLPAGATELPTIGVTPEPVQQPVEPRELQKQALAALEATRLAGHAAGLVVMATGLGKTWVAAFDTARPEFRRVLFIAHREEILNQSLMAFRQVRPDAQLGKFTGSEKRPDADVVFASVQTLTNRLHEFDPEEFDYVVVDEFHHAAAHTYRRVIDHFDPSFLLGLTATPERMDGADLLALCGDNLVFECDLVEGIRRKELVPFHYAGIADTVDFDPIPWRNGKFDTATLSQAVQTNERAQRAFDEWEQRGGERTLAFCCTTDHADFMAAFFRDQGVPSASVHSGASSDPRTRSVEDLTDGTVRVLFAVDIFNEGFDLPELDTVLMLRPTESPVIFLQQLGRGLRLSESKAHLEVIDFIGNHRSFLMKPRALLSLGQASEPSRRELETAIHDPESIELPEGCSVTWDLGAVDFFAQLLTVQGKAANALTEFVLDHFGETGVRPTAAQAFHSRLNVNSAASSGGWFALLRDLEVLTDGERAAVDVLGAILRQIEKEPLSRSYKLVTLRALLHDDALRTGAPVERVAEVAHRLVTSDPRLVTDATSGSMDPTSTTPTAWLDFWQRNPITALTTEGKRTGDALFRVVGGRFEPTFSVPANVGAAFDELVAELVEYRMAKYLQDATAAANTIRLRVSHTRGKPILFLDRRKHPSTPEGSTPVIADGRRHELDFVKIAVNVARRDRSDENVLPELLRGWFGENAGHPGTDHTVVLRNESGRWTLSPTAPPSSAPSPLVVDGVEIDAVVSITVTDKKSVSVTFESAGGKKGTPSDRNPDYVVAIEAVLERTRALGLSLSDAFVDSQRTRALTIDERRLQPEGQSFPIEPTHYGEIVDLRKRLLRPMSQVGQTGAKKSSGSQRKRMTLQFVNSSVLDHDELMRSLRFGPEEDPTQAVSPA
ncbi:DEAD/DEAH box helicase family protein [Actinospongicola halichondriae]|uniref:DEAD/DEAH box helicase family protein n=1 Tax=Actinospongicola halichondriae TaxID=3236844 RepID=UPI003D5164C5